MENTKWYAELRGTHFLPEPNQMVAKMLQGGQPLLVMREPTNPHDRNAILVADLMGLPLGYVAKEVAARVAPHMDAGKTVMCRVYSRRVLLLWVDGDQPIKTLVKAQLDA